MWAYIIIKEIINVYICLHGHINIHIKQALQLEKFFFPTAHILEISYCLSFKDSQTVLFTYNEQGKNLLTNNEYLTVP